MKILGTTKWRAVTSIAVVTDKFLIARYSGEPGIPEEITIAKRSSGSVSVSYE